MSTGKELGEKLVQNIQKNKNEAAAEKKKQGKYGLGLSHNSYLELLTIVFLACAGIIIKLCFSESSSPDGNMGPASSTIWGFGLTAIALSIMAFMGIYISSQITKNELNFLGKILNILPIVLTLFVIIYIIYLNFSFFTRINSNKVTREYHRYSYISSTFLIVQIILISLYLFNSIDKTNRKTYTTRIELYKSGTYILCAINFIFILMIHINLAVFSTDEV